MGRHRLLERQLRRAVGGSEAAGLDLERLLDLVDAAYRQADLDHELLERSLNLMSEELLQRNEELQATLAAERARHDRMARHNRVLMDLASGVAEAAGELDGAVQRVLCSVGATLDVERTSVWLYDRDLDQLRCLDLYERSRDRHSSGLVLNAADYPAYFRALAAGRIIAADDAVEDPATHEFASGYLRLNGITSMLDAAVRVGGQLAGVVCHEHVGPARAWSPEEQVFAASIADLVSVLLETFRRRLAEQARARLEEELRQAQRIESIGLLAGGVAHDFNNLLTPILACSEAALLSVPAGDALRGDLEDIVDSARRAKELTAQLLAFGRKQLLDVRAMDLDQEVRHAHRMLRRLIPSNIEIDLDLGPGQAIVRADPAQIQQVLVNLAINARDAMPTGGRLTLQTRVTRGNEAAAEVVLRVVDTGMGMDEATASQIFEPFFTTKSLGRGTGLGLSTVHGIVKQHGGSIRVDTRHDAGTAFEIRLPLVEGVQQAAPVPRVAASPSPRRGGTLLVVEDEPVLRRLVTRVLQARGYTVLAASSGEEALAVAREEHAGRIDLLLNDVVLQGITGRVLYDRLQEEGLVGLALFMSGYPRDELGQSGILERGVRFLQKPFTGEELACKVEDVLSGRAAGSPPGELRDEEQLSAG